MNRFLALLLPVAMMGGAFSNSIAATAERGSNELRWALRCASGKTQYSVSPAARRTRSANAAAFTT